MRISIPLLAVGALVLALSGCSANKRSTPGGPENDVVANVAKVNADQAGAPLSQTYTEQQRQDLANNSYSKPPEMNISGVAFALGQLPESLAGKTFYSTETFGGQVAFTSGSDGVFKPYKQADIPITYKVKNMDTPVLAISYKEGAAEKTVIYEITRGEQFAILHLAEPSDPWPILLKGIAE